jgi:hypothetical protein
MRALSRGRLRLAMLVFTGAACFALTLGSSNRAQGQRRDRGASTVQSGLPEVHRQGSDLVAGGERFRVWGFNYGLGQRYPILGYFERPTARGLQSVVADMRRARLLGANTLRVYLEIKTFMKGPKRPRRRALAALAALLDRAEQLHVYLDLTGNLVWRAPPAWYDALPERARWAVQARFWRAVARTAHGSPAVLVYELTSEPVIGDSEHWYYGELDGYTFIQRIVRDTAGRDRSELARRWIRLLTAAIRAHDRRHLIGVGLLPFGGAFGPANVADLLDLLLVHEYPQEGRESEAISLVREFAAQGKPVVLGETAPLLGTPATWRAFLHGSRGFLDGYLFFHDGRAPGEVGATAADAWYAAALDQFLDLRGTLLPALRPPSHENKADLHSGARRAGSSAVRAADHDWFTTSRLPRPNP